MDYGYFDDKNREYVITNPKTPVKWINYVGTLAFGGFVDQTGGALICKGDPTLSRITKYIQQLPASEFKGETLYLRIPLSLIPSPLGEWDRGQGIHRIFSPFFVPTLDAYDLYECHVGLGYTRIISEFFGLRTEATIFVPIGDGREIRDIRITNVSGASIEVDAIPVLEYTHPDALKQYTNADWVPQTMQSRAAREPGGQVVLLQYPFMFRDFKVNYFTSNLPVSSFETDRARFLGDHEYGTWADPLSLHQPELSNYEAQRGDNIAALLHHLGVLQPGETRRLITQLGQESTLDAARPAIERYRTPEAVDSALAELSRFWDGYLSKFQVHTPDPALDSMLNIHNPRQCFITKNWSRYLSYYQLGLGSRGIGCRDGSQDVMAVVSSAPEDSKTFIRQLLSIQRRDGSAYHQFNPLSMEASEGDALERDDRLHYYSDDHLWIVLAVTAYLKETGDLTFLDEVVPFYEKNGSGRPLESCPVSDHLKRAVAFTQRDAGAHGLPRLGFADWNDTMNLATGAESLFTANIYGKALLEMSALAQFMNETAAADAYRASYDEMKNLVNQHAWDGEWFLSYFDADGTPLGSQRNRYGQIYAYGQAWPVISGFAAPERAIPALEAVYHRLNTRNGIKLSAPGFNGFNPRQGGITTYPPGAKENGGIFLHVNPWVIIAETLAGHGDRAYAYYRQINPVGKNDKIDEFEVEPYVYPQNILADEHPQFGLGRNSWLSGTASWAYQAGTQYLLGIRPSYTGLVVDPCIPAAWDEFTVTRVFRGTTYNISVANPRHVNKGVASMLVDGKAISGNTLPLFLDGGAHQVLVTLG